MPKPRARLGIGAEPNRHQQHRNHDRPQLLTSSLRTHQTGTPWKTMIM